MATFDKVILSDDELDTLSNADFAEIARKGRLDKEISIDELKGVTPDTLVRFEEYLKTKERTGIKKETLEGLEGLVAKVGVSPVPVATPNPAETPKKGPTEGITNLSTRARTAMESKLGTLNSKNGKEFFGTFQKIYAKVPGSEPTDLSDISDAVNQSRTFNQKLIAALEFEYSQDTATLPVGWFTNMPGWFPALQMNHNFNKDGYQGLFGVDAKRKYIMDVMEGLALAWEKADTTLPAGIVNVMESLAGWALPVFGSAALLLFSGRVVRNVMIDGIKKPGIGEAIGWSAGKTWDGTKWVVKTIIPGAKYVAKKVGGGKISALAGTSEGSSVGTVSADFDPETNTLDRATREKILQNMWEIDRATQEKIINDIYARESANYSSVSKTEFIAGVRNPASYTGDTKLFSQLNAEYMAEVGKISGASLAPDFETYKSEVLEGTDIMNRAEYDARLGKVLEARAKEKSAKDIAEQQKAQANEGRALSGDIKRPGKGVGGVLKAVGRVTPGIKKFIPPDSITKPLPGAIAPSEAINQAQNLRRLAKAQEGTKEVVLSDGAKVTLAKLDSPEVEKVTAFEKAIKDAEESRDKAKERIAKARFRLAKELDYQELTATNASGNAPVGSIQEKQQEIERYEDTKVTAQTEIESIEGNSTYHGKRGFDQALLKTNPADNSKYEQAKRMLAENTRKAQLAEGELSALKEKVKTYKVETFGKTRFTEAQIRAHIGVSSALGGPATGLELELETASNKIKGLEVQLGTEWESIARKYSSRVSWDASTRMVTIDSISMKMREGGVNLAKMLKKI